MRPFAKLLFSRVVAVMAGVRLPDGSVVLDRDTADDRLRLPVHEPGVSARHRARHVPVVLRYHHADSHDRARLRQAVAAQETRADTHVQQARSHLSTRRTTLPAVPRRRLAEVAHRRGPGDHHH